MKKETRELLEKRVYPECELKDFLAIQKDVQSFLDNYVKAAVVQMNAALELIKPLGTVYLMIDGFEVETFDDTEINITIGEEEC